MYLDGMLESTVPAILYHQHCVSRLIKNAVLLHKIKYIFHSYSDVFVTHLKEEYGSYR